MRFKPTRAEASQLAAIEADLDVVRLGQASAVETTLPAIRALLRTETMLVATPVERADGSGLELERFHTDNFPDPIRLRRAFARFFRSAQRRYAWYDAIRPEPEQRNKVIEAHDVIVPEEFEPSKIYQEVLLPLGLHRHRQPRVLLCDGASLLAWFGSFHTEPIEPRQKRLLAALVPALRRRLIFERQLQAAPRTHAALEVALEQLGVPAFLVGGRGTILETNSAGRALLATRAVEVRASLQDRIAGRRAAMPFELTALHERGAPDGWLAVLPAATRDDRIRASVAGAAARWRLTRRQGEVLEQLVSGHANTTIAAFFGIGERAVELHVTAIFDRAGVDSRSALVARVLLGD